MSEEFLQQVYHYLSTQSPDTTVEYTVTVRCSSSPVCQTVFFSNKNGEMDLLKPFIDDPNCIVKHVIAKVGDQEFVYDQNQ